ncbi:MAG TPA: hypothetical protein VG917_00010 [Patescibacteria group bacterium]|nr:hypothetical protein [Patescibacteria group bacterium]
MKPQDVLFILILVGLLYKRNPKYCVVAGLVSILLSLPLFGFWVFFTAERLVYYGVAFILVAIIMFLIKIRR